MVKEFANKKYLSKTAQKAYLDKEKNPRHKLITALMLFAGLRVSEAISLKWESVNFQKNLIVVKSLKKRKDKNGRQIEKLREIPMDEDLAHMLREFYKKSKKGSEFIFPSPKNRNGHISRGAVWKKNKKINKEISPHIFRHSFGFNHAEKADISTLRDLLGHENIMTTSIYAHSDLDRKEKAIERVRGFSLIRWIKKKVFPPQNVVVIPHRESIYSVGRLKELKELAFYFENRINVVVLAADGKHGSGRKHILRQLEGANILRLDEIGAKKQTLGALLREVATRDPKGVGLLLGIDLMLDENGNEIEKINDEDLIKAVFEHAKFKNFVNKENADSIAEVLIKACRKKEWTILVEDITDISLAKTKIIEKLKNHFHLILTGRRVSFNKSEFLSGFEVMKIGGLTRAESVELIERASADYRGNIENFEIFKNHIYDQTDGKPKFILQLVDRYRVERFVSVQKIRNVRHTGAVKEIDFSVFLLILFICFGGLKYYMREASDIDKNAGMLIGTMIMVCIYFVRPILDSMRRKTV